MSKPPPPKLQDVSSPRARPLVIAHRGARHEAPENTLPAFQRALELGAEGIELDCLLTEDKVPVVTHDDDLSKLTHHRGYVHSLPFDTVRGIDVGSHFSAASAGVTMPTLAETLELIARHDVLTIVEIKAQPGLVQSAARLIGGIVGDIRMRGRTVISSSHTGLLRELKLHHPQIPRAWIVRWGPFPFFRLPFFARLAGISGIHASLRAIARSGFSERVKAMGLELLAWTANEPAELERCLQHNVDGIITDDPPFAQEQLGGSPNAARR